MPTPQFNVRVPERYHDLLRLIVERLRANPDGADALADALSAVCRQAASGAADSLPSTADSGADSGADSLPSPADSARLDAIEDRLDALEEREPRMVRIEALEARMVTLEQRMDGIGRTAPAPPRQPRQATAGKRQSRPKYTDDLHRQIHDLGAKGMAHREIAKKLGISPSGVTKYMHKPRPAD
jgi:hypothetical protein